MTLPNDDFSDFQSVHESPTYFHLSSLLQMLQMLMLSSTATSRVVVRGSALMISLNWLLSASDGWPALLVFKALISFENLFNHYYTVHSLVPGPAC